MEKGRRIRLVRAYTMCRQPQLVVFASFRLLSRNSRTTSGIGESFVLHLVVGSTRRMSPRTLDAFSRHRFFLLFLARAPVTTCLSQGCLSKR